MKHHTGQVKKLHHTIQLSPKTTELRSILAFALLLFVSLIILSKIISRSHNAQAYATALPTATGASVDQFVDAVIVLDNVSQIGNHDPNNDRFSAASLFVDLSSEGDYIGTVQITGSTDPIGSGYHTLTDMNEQGKSTLKSVFADDKQRGIDTRPTAYFTPALKEAGNMLLGDTSGRKRYIIIVTDTLAQSGDQGTCPEADKNYKWYCTVGSLEQQGISVTMIAFASTSTSQTEFAPTYAYVTSHGGAASQVESGATLLQDLTTEYTKIFSSIHPNTFVAELDPVPSTIDIDLQIANELKSITFVALGASNVALSDLRTPDNLPIAGKQDKAGNFYFSQGSIYWLQTVGSGRLYGTWHITPSAISPPTKLLVLVSSKVRFKLLDPIPATMQGSNLDSDVSVRYVPQGTTLLRASVTNGAGEPLPADTLTVTSPCCSPFGTADTPPLIGNDPTDVSVPLMLDTVQPSGDLPLQIGLGKPISQNIYLHKTFMLRVSDQLQHVNLSVNPVTEEPLNPQTNITVSASGVNNPTITSASLSLFNHIEEAPWQLLGSSSDGGKTANASFPIVYGCGAIYEMGTMEKVHGVLGGNSYEYYTYATTKHAWNLVPILSGTATSLAVDDPVLLIGSSHVTWNVSLTTTLCAKQQQTVSMSFELKGAGFDAPGVTLGPGQGYYVEKNAAYITISSSQPQKTVTLQADIDACKFSSLFPPDAIASLRLVPHSQGTAVPMTQLNVERWRKDVSCPSVFTTALHKLPALLGGGFLLFLTFNYLSNVRAGSRKRYLVGQLQYVSAIPDVTLPDVTPASPIDMPPLLEEDRIQVFYLDYLGSDPILGEKYEIVDEESTRTLLKFSIGTDGESPSPRVIVSATRYAIGPKTPFFENSNSSMPLRPTEEHICDGPIQIDKHLIIPDIDIC